MSNNVTNSIGRAPKFKKIFDKVIEDHFPGEAASLIARTEARYHKLFVDVKFAKHSSNPIDKRLDFCAYFLALIQTLESDGISLEQIRTTCLSIAHAYVSPRNIFQKYFKLLPPKLIGLPPAKWLLGLLNEKVNKLGHPDGFRANIITDPLQTYGFGYAVDIIECGICKLFQRHDAAKYASILCDVDEITSGLAGLELIRKGTIAKGAVTCDFRFKKL